MPVMPAVRARLLAGVAVVLVLLGAAFTAHGWFHSVRGVSPISRHAALIAGLWVSLMALVLGLGRWHRVGILQLGFLSAGALSVAFGRGAALAVVLLLGLAAVALGRLLLSARLRSASDLDCLLVGLAVYGTLISLIVHIPVNYPGVYAALLVLPVVGTWRRSQATLQNVWQWLSAPRTTSAWTFALSTALVAVVLVHFLVALMPERGYDALVTHLLLPARIAWQHVWAFDVDNYVWAVMPLLGDWLYTIGYMLGGETGARLVNLGAFVVLARLVYEVAVWAGARKEGALWAVLLFVSTPLALTETSSMFIECVWSCFVLGGALALLRLMTDRRDGAVQLVVGGVLLAAALATKAVTFMVLPVLALMLAMGIRRWWSAGLWRAMVAGATAFVAIGALPYVRAWVMTGNPVFPFFNGHFQSPHYAPENFTAPSMFEIGMTWDVLYRITFESAKFLESRAGAAGFQWVLVVGPVIVLCLLAWQRRGLVLLSIAFGIAWLTFAQTAYLRYVLPSFALAAAAAGMAIAGLRPARSLASWSLGLAAIAAVVLNVFYFSSGGFQHALNFRVLLSESARIDFLRDNQPTRLAVEVVNGLNQSHRPVAFLCKPFATGLQADGLFPTWYNWKFQMEVTAAKTAAALGSLLGAHEAQYVILLDSWSSEVMRENVRAVTHEVKRIGSVSVRELDARFRFQKELLRDSDLAATGVAEAQRWQLGGVARLQPGLGAVLRTGDTAQQRAAIEAGREYRLTAVLQPQGGPAKARVVMKWLDAADRGLRQETEVFPCADKPEPHTMQHVAPNGTKAVLVTVSCEDGTTVVLRSLSLTN